MRKPDNTQSLKEVIETWIQGAGKTKQYKSVRVVNAWHSLMGIVADKHTEKIWFSEGLLVIYLNSSVLREDLWMQKTKLIDSLNEELGEELVLKVELK